MEPQAKKSLRTGFATVGAVAFFVASGIVAVNARHYQVVGEPMPNGKGGFMTPDDGYMLASVLLLIAIAWLLAARRFWRSTPA
jgi:hypothetical protein